MAKRARSSWSHWWAKALLVAVVLAALFIGGSVGAARFTESDRFCGTDCHEMWPYRDTWAQSKHRNTDCVKCHIPPGAVNFITTKLYASREVWVHLTGQVKAPIKVTRHIPNVACERSGCHASSQVARTLKLGRPAPVTFKHASQGHAAKLCIACHASLVHEEAPGVTAPPARSMPSCFVCHTDGPQKCTYCHRPPHGDRGACQDCHNLGSWGGGKNFTHPGGSLAGRHAQVACQDCHRKGISVKPDGCITCHGDQHNGLPSCVACHSIQAWTPFRFAHPQEGPHVPHGEEPLPCDACHQGGFGQRPGCPCHGGKPPSGD
ncbi:MAG: NapC/NirT family cytochrome c [Thermoleophilia bacterium]